MMLVAPAHMPEPPAWRHERAAGQCGVLVEDRVVVADEVYDAMLTGALIELEIDGHGRGVGLREVVAAGHRAFDVDAVAARAVEEGRVQGHGRGDGHGDGLATTVEGAHGLRCN